MKKIIFVTLALAFTSAGVYAQSATTTETLPGHTKLSADEQAKAATDQLNAKAKLTADQYAKVLQVNKNFYANTGKQPAAQVANEREAQIKAILTPEQQAKVQAAKPTGALSK